MINTFKQKAFKKYHPQIMKIRKFIFGMKSSQGVFNKIIIYFLLSILGFVFLYPIIYMFSLSLMSNIDLVDNTIKWIPSTPYVANYTFAFRALEFIKSLIISIYFAGTSTIAVLISSALIGYGLARFPFKGRKLVIALILVTFIMPKALFFIPTYEIMGKLELKGTMLAIIIPALTGQGVQSALFILIFFQFFNMIPKSLEEAAIVDGANSFVFLYKIAIPMVIPAIIITSVYSFALYWNETFLSSVYLEGKIRTLPMMLESLQSNYEKLQTELVDRNPEIRYSEAKAFAGTLLSITPLIVLYAIVQRWFVESIDKTGITGE